MRTQRVRTIIIEQWRRLWDAPLDYEKINVDSPSVGSLYMVFFFFFCQKSRIFGLVFKRISYPTCQRSWKIIDEIKVFCWIVPSFFASLISSFISIIYCGLIRLSRQSAHSLSSLGAWLLHSACPGAWQLVLRMDSLYQPHGLSIHS